MYYVVRNSFYHLIQNLNYLQFFFYMLNKNFDTSNSNSLFNIQMLSYVRYVTCLLIQLELYEDLILHAF